MQLQTWLDRSGHHAVETVAVPSADGCSFVRATAAQVDSGSQVDRSSPGMGVWALMPSLQPSCLLQPGCGLLWEGRGMRSRHTRHSITPEPHLEQESAGALEMF